MKMEGGRMVKAMVREWVEKLEVEKGARWEEKDRSQLEKIAERSGDY